MLIRTLLAIAMLSFACTQASRLLQQDVVASDPTLIDRSQPDWYVSMELQQQQQQQQQTELVELASLGAAAPSSTVIGDGTAAETRVASLVRAAAAKQGRKKPRANRRPPPKPSPRAEASPASAPSPKPSPAPSPALSPSPSPRRSPAPSPSPSPSPRSCLATPSDVLGPFYQSQGVPLNTKPDESFCALKTGGRNATKITITGHVLQYFTCTPVSESSSLAFIDVWQADNAGEYDDNSNLANADCRTRVPIAADGSYKYTTIIPAAYGSRNCLRPPHIHLRLALPGYTLLVTQMYFAGSALNGPGDCGCGGCGSGNPLQQVLLDPVTGAGVFDILLKRQR
ncbi:hypothetical protein CHLRE_15g640600v5 [Chlamydomonas reinhardtii]|uniref:Intradiol ring-cleavage dioxygenases domain-containing protein n=1 Tax=Chlamydomonas reinhardtii TaxID=3055 RepID=A0A2K3CWM9_CHLRE|nr:uncharacterized protein CHLRE_15g640600v5 [Chlamydomonas reinhardtii]PNW72678.1 hypothetical protein CHLRE_15g640600v5 [Chlamydomonas reinhardtii]